MRFQPSKCRHQPLTLNTFVNITYGSFFLLEVKVPFSEMHKSCLTDSERCIQPSISDHRKVWNILSLAVTSLSYSFPVCRCAPTTTDTLPIRKFRVGAVPGLHPHSGHPLSMVLRLPGAVCPHCGPLLPTSAVGWVDHSCFYRGAPAMFAVWAVQRKPALSIPMNRGQTAYKNRTLPHNLQPPA